jgi:methylenetetrahydrofolate reductase (NADPH)
MKVIEHIERAKAPIFSFEIVPPPRGRSINDIVAIVESLLPMNPSWIDVTSHASNAYYNEKPDGSIERKTIRKRPGTLGICGVIQNRFRIDTVAHILSQGFTKEETEDALIELNFLGIHNVLALRGDSPNYQKEKTKSRAVNNYANELVEQIQGLKQGVFLDGSENCAPLDFSVGVAGYPEKHFEAANFKTDIQRLKQKIDAGADYVVTQMFFDNSKYFKFVEACREAGITVPIIPGLKILRSEAQLKSIPKNFYIDFPEALVDEAHANPKHILEVGKNWASKQVEELLSKNVPYIHFYIMNDTENVVSVLKKFQK